MPGDHRQKMQSCVRQVQAQGRTQESARRICGAVLFGKRRRSGSRRSGSRRR